MTAFADVPLQVFAGARVTDCGGMPRVVLHGRVSSVGEVVFGSFRGLFEIIATSAATLTGLLFVAMSVEKSGTKTHPAVIRDFRAAAALLAFTNPLAVSLFGLIPKTNIGYPAVVLGVIGALFTVAGTRTIVTLPELRGHRRPQLTLIVILLVAFGFELVFGIDLIAHGHRSSAVAAIGDVLVTSLLIGIARAWELVGDWDTGIVSSIGLLVGHRPVALKATEATSSAEPPPPEGATT